ncbi:hypothetical protein PWT90_01155 [Aphanocladium album]|nr:hypothetical protein PWT90_01155 [Aphanocladium album]
MEAWLKSSGAAGLDDLEVADFPITGRGVRARRHFRAGDKILTIPAANLWTVQKARAEPILGPILASSAQQLSDEDTLALYLLFVRSREQGYEGQRSHVAAMPARYSSSIFFTDEELQVSEGTSLNILTEQLRERVENDYRKLLMNVLVQHPDVFALEKFTLNDYKWALCTVWSRAMDFKIAEGNSVRLIAPFADMLNHSYEAKQCHAYDPNSGNLTVLAGKDYEAGDQAFINYGPVANHRLLRLYGFVLPDNPHDSYDLVLQTSSMAPLYEQKRRFWKMGGLDAACKIPLTREDPLPTSLLRYLRIQRMEEGDFPAMTLQLVNNADAKLSDGNEVQILQFLLESIGSVLSGFAIPLETLEKQLASGTYAAGSNAWAAAQVSVSEQQILKLAEKKAENLMQAVGRGGSSDKQCANCAKDDGAQLMACGRCKTVKYCGRPCQVAHFKTHKAACRAAAAAAAASS